MEEEVINDGQVAFIDVNIIQETIKITIHKLHKQGCIKEIITDLHHPSHPGRITCNSQMCLKIDVAHDNIVHFI